MDRISEINKEFVPYEQALALRKLGFKEPCFGYYTGDKRHLVLKPSMNIRNEELNDIVCTAPTFSQAFRFFREKHNLFMLMQVGQHNEKHQTFYFNVFKFSVNLYKSKFKSKTGIYTYEEAELECLIELIKIVKNKIV